MKFTLSWLRTHLETDATLDRITDTLTRIGLELEGVEDRGAALAPFRIAHVIEAVQHPNADRLRACKVDTGDGIVSVVCGAPNARTGMKAVFAPPGSYHPGHRHHAESRRNPRRAKRRHAAVRARDGARRRPCRHHRAARGRAGRHVLCRAGPAWTTR